MRESISHRVYILVRKFCNKFSIKSPRLRRLDDFLFNFEKSIILWKYSQEWWFFTKGEFQKVNGVLYPTPDTIRDLHDFLITKYQQSSDKINAGELTSAELEFYGLKYYEKRIRDNKEDIINRGAHIFNKFLEGHPFIDGNKRTGWVTLWIFLRVNGVEHNIPSDYPKGNQLEQVKVWANGKKKRDNIEDIKIWIRRFVR